MATEKVAKILRAKLGLTSDQIAALSDADAWGLVYSDSHSRRKKPTGQVEVCFTGFTEAEKESIGAIAAAAGFLIRTGVSKNLAILCIGDEPGASKVTQAQEKDVEIITADEFIRRYGGKHTAGPDKSAPSSPPKQDPPPARESIGNKPLSGFEIIAGLAVGVLTVWWFTSR